MECRKSGNLVEVQRYPNKEELGKINTLTRREFSPEELYCFSVVLCDNDIDRETEQFDRRTLEELAGLFVGKTGICDHEASSKNQQARIYEANVEEIKGKTNALGEPYCALVAKAYMVRTESNKDLILEIEAGIKKEVSVGCNVREKVCSICQKGREDGGCEHIKGKRYGGRLCYTILRGAQDAYEWSFVAVPAQRSAGVIKSMTLKMLQEDEEQKGVWLDAEEAKQLKQTLKRLTEDCSLIRKNAKKELMKSIVQKKEPDEKNSRLLWQAMDHLTVEQMKAFGEILDGDKKELEESQFILKENKTNMDKRFMI